MKPERCHSLPFVTIRYLSSKTGQTNQISIQTTSRIAEHHSSLPQHRDAVGEDAGVGGSSSSSAGCRTFFSRFNLLVALRHLVPHEPSLLLLIITLLLPLLVLRLLAPLTLSCSISCASSSLFCFTSSPIIANGASSRRRRRRTARRCRNRPRR